MSQGPPQAFGSERDEPLRALATARADGREEATPAMLAALHLAAHAVAAEACGLGYPDLITAPSGCGFAPARDGRGGGPARNGIEAAIIASLAATEAERLAGGDPGRPCSDVARWLTDGDPRDAEPYIEWLRLKAERTVEHPLRQRVILVIANALLEGGAVTGQEIEELAAREAGRYMRGQ